MAHLRSRTPLVVTAALTAGLLLAIGCEPRKKAKTGGVATPVTATTTAVATAPTATTAATPTATASTTAAPTTTTAPTTYPTTAGTWPTGVPPIDPAVVADVLAKAAAAIGMPAPAGAGSIPGDPLEATIKANAAKYAPGFTAASPIGRAKLKSGEHAGMNMDMDVGRCYVVLGAGGAGVTQLGVHLLFPAAPPNAVMASDTAHGNQPVIGEGKPLCPPVKASVRVDTSPITGAGDVAVQVWAK